MDLNANTIIVYQFLIPNYPFPASAFWRVLAQDEKIKTATFAFNQDRLKYQFSRGLLRHLLSQYVAIDPEKIVFGYTAFGKPYMEYPGPIKFNLSHTKDALAIALSMSVEVGIDLEKILPISHFHSICESHFSCSEKAYVKSAPLQEQVQAFYHCWSRKEALIKSMGSGLGSGIDLRKLDALSPMVNIAGNNWWIQSLEATTGYVAALSYSGVEKQIIQKNGLWKGLLNGSIMIES